MQTQPTSPKPDALEAHAPERPSLEPLSQEHLQAWRVLRRMVALVGAAVTRDLTEAADLSGMEFIVLTWLEDQGQGQMRQVDLAEQLEVNKSQLSHLLSRLEERALLERQPVGKKGVMVHITPQGRTLKRQAQPIYEGAIQRHFAQRLRPDQLQAILEMADQIGVKPRIG